MRNKVKIATAILGLLFYCYSSVAQEINCGKSYELALSQYNNGLADSALSILEPCLLNNRVHKDLSKDQSVNIFRLGALSSIMVGQAEDAAKYVREMLKYDPDYSEHWREGDLEEFRHMIEGVTSQASFKLGLRAGINFPLLNLQKNYTDPPKSAPRYSLESHTGFQFSVFSEMGISRNMALETGIGLLHVRFDYQVQSSQTGSYVYEEEITYIEIPILVKYYLPLNGALKPYLQGGVFGKFDLYKRENSDEFGKYWFTESSDSEKTLATFVSDLENLGISVGAGAIYKLKNISIGADIRYVHHFDSQNKLAKFDDIQDYEDIPSTEPIAYTNDINLISLSDLQISLVLTYNLRYKVF